MIILGIDPGTATTGFGIIQKKANNTFAILDYGVINTKTTSSDADRLKIIANDLNSLIKKYKPTLVGVEKLFFNSNQKTAMTVSQARGAILLTFAQHNLNILEFTPLQVKNRLCGYGKAEKKQVQFMVKQIFKLSKIPKPDDAADALAIALCAGFENPKLK